MKNKGEIKENVKKRMSCFNHEKLLFLLNTERECLEDLLLKKKEGSHSFLEVMNKRSTTMEGTPIRGAAAGWRR